MDTLKRKKDKKLSCTSTLVRSGELLIVLINAYIFLFAGREEVLCSLTNGSSSKSKVVISLMM